MDALGDAGVAWSDSVTDAAVAQDEDSAAAGVTWTATVASAWQTQQEAEADALVAWIDATSAADSAAMDGLKTATEAWNSTYWTAWQTKANAVLSALGGAVSSWRVSAGTNFAQLVQVQVAAWINAMQSNVATTIVEGEADFEAEMQKEIDEVEAANSVFAQEADAAVDLVHDEAAAIVSRANADADYAADMVSDAAHTWQQHEQDAMDHQVTRDQSDADALIDEVEAAELAGDVWDTAEETDAFANQQTAAQETKQSQHAEADALRMASDQIADARQTRAGEQADVAEGRDDDLAEAYHDLVYEGSDDIVATVDIGAAQAETKTITQVTAAANLVAPEVAARLTHIRQMLSLAVSREISAHDAALARAAATLPAAKAEQVEQAEQQQSQHQSMDVAAFAGTDPTRPQSSWQVAADYMPSWKSLAYAGLGLAAAVVIPGAGAAMAAVAFSGLVNGFVGRMYDNNQSLLQAGLGAAADASGLTNLYAGLTNRDLVSGDHLGLTLAEQRQMLASGAVETAGSLMGAYRGARNVQNFARNRAAQAPCPCFPAGTPIRTLSGSKPMETIVAGDLVLSVPENDPAAPVEAKLAPNGFIAPRH